MPAFAFPSRADDWYIALTTCVVWLTTYAVVLGACAIALTARAIALTVYNGADDMRNCADREELTTASDWLLW